MRSEYRAIYKNIGDKGDQILAGKTVSVLGLGGAGAHVASRLGREGVELRLVDMGRVEEEDMHRLSIFYEEDITKFKVKQAKARINAINPSVAVKSFHEELTEENVFLLKGDCIVDASNNLEINKIVMKHALDNKIPLVTIRYSGDQARIQVTQKKVAQKTLDKLDLPPLTKTGVFGPLTSMAGSHASSQVLKVLLGASTSQVIEIDAWKPKLKVSKL